MAVVPFGFCDVSMRFTLAGYPRSAFTTFGAAPDPTLTPDEISILVDEVWKNPAAGPNRLLDSDVIMDGVTVRLGTPTNEPIVGFHGSSTPGGSGIDSPSPNNAVLVHKRTNRGGRRGRGRMFLPWMVSEGSILSTGTLSSAYVADMQTAMNFFLTQLAQVGLPMVLLHDPGKSPELEPNVITTLQVDSVISTQRKRVLR